MYTQGMFMNLHRSPEGADSAGEMSPAAGAGESGGGESASAEAAAAPQYVSKADFDTAMSRFEQSLSRMAPREREEPRQDNSRPSAPKEPNLSEYDFKNPKDLARYNRDNYKWNAYLDEQENAPARQKEASDRSWRETQSAHAGRISEYRKENPAFETDLKTASIPQVEEAVKRAVFASKNSHLAVHYMAKNPEAARELNDLYYANSDISVVRERIGEMVASMKAEQRVADANATAAGQRPPRQNLRGGSGTAPRKPSKEEMFERFHAS